MNRKIETGIEKTWLLKNVTILFLESPDTFMKERQKTWLLKNVFVFRISRHAKKYGY